MYACSEQASHLRNLIRAQSAYLRRLTSIYTVFIRYTDPFVKWAMSHEKGTIVYADYEGSEQATGPQLMLRLYNTVVKISSQSHNSHKMSSLIFSEKINFRLLSATFLNVDLRVRTFLPVTIQIQCQTTIYWRNKIDILANFCPLSQWNYKIFSGKNKQTSSHLSSADFIFNQLIVKIGHKTEWSKIITETFTIIYT